MVVRALKQLLGWLNRWALVLLLGLLALICFAEDKLLLGGGVAALAIGLVAACRKFDRHCEEMLRREAEFNRLCASWTCPYCGHPYGEDSIFVGQGNYEEAYGMYASIRCAHCDRFNVFAKDGTWVDGYEEPFEKLWQELEAE